MATLVKEKRRKKKSNKEKCPDADLKEPAELPICSSSQQESDTPDEIPQTEENTMCEFENCKVKEENIDPVFVEEVEEVDDDDEEEEDDEVLVLPDNPQQFSAMFGEHINVTTTMEIEISEPNSPVHAYRELNAQLADMSLMQEPDDVLEAQEAGVDDEESSVLQSEETQTAPSAPAMEENIPNAPVEEILKEPIVPCFPIEQAMEIFAGNEMVLWKVMSEREEAIVEAGSGTDPEEHLADLLSTFKNSIMALERERANITKSYADEEKYRTSLWKIEKRQIAMKEECSCGINVELKATYEYAELMKEKVPVARLKLESLLKDVEESYCHHQHSVLLMHYQIEEFLSQIIKCDKKNIRHALAQVLQAMRNCDHAPDLLPKALERWAGYLAEGLIDARDPSDLLFLIHHLFRQTRSVAWATRVVRLPMVDRHDALRAIGFLHTLLNNTKLDTAQECTEDVSEGWEEMSLRGAGAVSEGCLREQDLLALIDAMPLRLLVARILNIEQADIRHFNPEWWGDDSGGAGVMRACGGARALLWALRGARAHYAVLRERLVDLVVTVLGGLATLYSTPRMPYDPNMIGQLKAELQACFTAGFEFFGPQYIHKLPTNLLWDDTAKDYCFTFILGLHDNVIKRVDSLDISIPTISCGECVRVVAHTAVNRPLDNPLAKTVLEFLLQTGIKRKSDSCKDGCESVARECIGLVLEVHPYLYPVAFTTLANFNQVDSLDASCIKPLNVHKWRPNKMEAEMVLNEWSARCNDLLEHLLLAMDFTPFTGVSLGVQRVISQWLCVWLSGGEARWRAMRALRPHAACWRLCTGAPPPSSPPTDLFTKLHAVLATDWGHSVPLICSEGVNVLLELARERPEFAAHCAAPIMYVMAMSPESIIRTPKFGEVFETLANCGPSLIQRALGRGGASGADLLQKLVVTQVLDQQWGGPRVFMSWTCALLSVGASAAALEAAAVLARDYTAIDMHVLYCLQELKLKNLSKMYIRLAHTTPLLCECVLRMSHKYEELHTDLYAILNAELMQQRDKKQKINVDKALQTIKADMSSEELAIYRSAAAAQSAPPTHPSHLYLWRLFMELYLTRPSDRPNEITPPVGTLYFSGIVKSHALNQIKKKLHEIKSYHFDELHALEFIVSKHVDPKPSTSNKVIAESIVDDNILPALTITDLLGNTEESEGDSDDIQQVNDGAEDMSLIEETREKQQQERNLLSYHTQALQMFREYLDWIEKGEKAIAKPQDADISRFFTEEALCGGWAHMERRIRGQWAGGADFPRFAPPPPPATPHVSPAQAALERIHAVKDNPPKGSPRNLESPLDSITFRDNRELISAVDKFFQQIVETACSWQSVMSCGRALSGRLWELVQALRVPRPLPPVRKQCVNKCRPIIFYITEREWCISTSAERDIKENRLAALNYIRQLARPRPEFARNIASLNNIACRISTRECALRALESCWRHAGACVFYAPATSVFNVIFTQLSERWVMSAGAEWSCLFRRFAAEASTLQAALAGALVCPRRLPRAHWPALYAAVLDARLPHDRAFSYLSKFEMSKWAEEVDDNNRLDIVKILVEAGGIFSDPPTASEEPLLELLCVHIRVLSTSGVLPSALAQCSRASSRRRLPARFWTHLEPAAQACAADIHFDQLAHLLRLLGEIWSEAGVSCHAHYAAPVTRVLNVLVRALVVAGIKMTFQPERVGWLVWNAAIEAWTPWLKPCKDNEEILLQFVDCVNQIMIDCPGCEVKVLQEVFEWAVSGAQSGIPLLLSELRGKLPWHHHQWFWGAALHAAAKMSPVLSAEYSRWVRHVSAATRGATLARGVPDDLLPVHLAQLLFMFTDSPARYDAKLIEETHSLPWYRLPEPALGEALDRFFAVCQDPSKAYHELPQFNILLYASELSASVPGSAHGAAKRARLVSQWGCAGAAHAHHKQHTSHAHCVLNVLHNAALFVCESELLDLVGRAMVMLCLEPAGTAALPVWCGWVRRCGAPCVRAAAGAAGLLTASHVRTFADLAVKALLDTCDEGWEYLVTRWHASPWRGDMFAVAGAVHSAYVSALTHTHTTCAQATLAAILDTNHNFVENEAILALWICYTCRVVRDCLSAGAARGAGGEAARDSAPLEAATLDAASLDAAPLDAAPLDAACSLEAGAEARAEDTLHAARALLSTWARATRRSLLSVVTLKADTSVPTPKHRILSQLALCYLDPSTENIREYEGACNTLFPDTASDVIGWGATASPNKVVRLAVRFYPTRAKYFSVENNYTRND